MLSKIGLKVRRSEKLRAREGIRSKGSWDVMAFRSGGSLVTDACSHKVAL
jgi:hypothetical protein